MKTTLKKAIQAANTVYVGGTEITYPRITENAIGQMYLGGISCDICQEIIVNHEGIALVDYDSICSTKSSDIKQMKFKFTIKSERPIEYSDVNSVNGVIAN